MNFYKHNRNISKYLLISILSIGLIFSYSTASHVLSIKLWATTSNPYVITNDQVKDNYLVYIKEKTNKGQEKGNSECQRGLGVGVLQGDDIICNPGLKNLQKKADKLDDNLQKGDELDGDFVGKLSEKLEKKKEVLSDKFEKLRERMEKAISEEEEEETPLPLEDKKKVDEQDVKTVEEHKSIEGDECRDGNVLDGASNEEDLKVLAECQEAVGDVMHTKKMDDGDYKFLLKLDDKYGYLINDKNDEKTDGLLVIEVVPDDQNIDKVVLPESGDKVHVWGAWVTDEPKGWHEIHPTWKITKE
jgi:hypothetical protein